MATHSLQALDLLLGFNELLVQCGNLLLCLCTPKKAHLLSHTTMQKQQINESAFCSLQRPHYLIVRFCVFYTNRIELHRFTLDLTSSMEAVAVFLANDNRALNVRL